MINLESLEQLELVICGPHSGNANNAQQDVTVAATVVKRVISGSYPFTINNFINGR